MTANRAIRIAAQRTQGLWGPITVFGARYEHQRTRAIRITSITLASVYHVLLFLGFFRSLQPWCFSYWEFPWSFWVFLHILQQCKDFKGSEGWKILDVLEFFGASKIPRKRRLAFTAITIAGPHLNPITINPVIRMSRLGPFFCPRDSEAQSEQFRARSLQPLFWSTEWASDEAPRHHLCEVKFFPKLTSDRLALTWPGLIRCNWIARFRPSQVVIRGRRYTQTQTRTSAKQIFAHALPPPLFALPPICLSNLRSSMQ